MKKKNKIKKPFEKRIDKDIIKIKHNESQPHGMSRLYVQPDIIKKNTNKDIKEDCRNIFCGFIR